MLGLVLLEGRQGRWVAPDLRVGQFILVAESRKPLEVAGYDHLGLLLDTRAEVDAALESVRRWQERDDRVRIKEYEDLDQGDVTVHAFYLRYLLPIWFDVQCMEWKPGAEPTRRWRYG